MLPTSSRRQHRRSGIQEPSVPPHSPHEVDIFHQSGKLTISTQFVEDLSPYEKSLIAIGEAEQRNPQPNSAAG